MNIEVKRYKLKTGYLGYNFMSFNDICEFGVKVKPRCRIKVRGDHVEGGKVWGMVIRDAPFEIPWIEHILQRKTNGYVMITTMANVTSVDITIVFTDRNDLMLARLSFSG